MFKRTISPSLKLAVLLITVGMLAVLQTSTVALADTNWALVYSEDFSLDPSFTSTAPSYVHWDAQQGNYYASIRDVSCGKGYYIGYSPEFQMVNGDFIMQFDFSILTPNWGNYPQIRALNTRIIEDPNDLTFRSGFYEPFYFAYEWADATQKKFSLGCRTDNLDAHTHYITDSHPVPGTWYHVRIACHSASNTADWKITKINDGSLFYAASDIQFPISAGFNRFYVGFITAPPEYGSTSDIQVDNIKIWALIKP